MGAVYVVEQVTTGRERALKLMHPMLVSDAKSIERFEREAQVGSRIESDHVVEVIAAGVEAAGPTPWICMELLKGETLADRLERGTPRREECLEIVEQLSHALVAAHRAGIVHRDLKPENIFLAESRQKGVPFTLKVLDFGVATLAQSSEVGGPKTTQGVGSPLWMAPEQTNVGKVALATDVWAVGLIAFNLVSGHSYWRTARTSGATITALLVEIMVEELSPASARAREISADIALPPGFDAWFARCLVRDPSARFVDASACFPPLLAMLAAPGQTLPPGYVAGDAPPVRSGATQPEGFAAGPPSGAGRAPVLSPTAFDETRPGPQLASGPQALAPSPAQAPAAVSTAAAPPAAWSSGPASPQPAQGMQGVPLHGATMQVAPRRAIWPWVLLTALGVGAMCAIGIGYQVVRGTQQVASTLEGHYVDPETGATVDLGPDGVHVRAAEPPATAMVPIGTDGETDTALVASDDEEAGSDDESEATDDETDTEDDSEDDSDEESADDEAADDSDDEESSDDDTDDEAEEDDSPAEGVRTARTRRRRPLLTALADAANRASPADHQQYRTRVIDPCWRGTFEGEATPPRARYTIDVRPGSILITPRDTPEQRRFAQCLGLRTPSTPPAPGHYVFTLP